MAGSLGLGGGLALGASSIALGGYLALMFTSYFRPRTARPLTRVPLDEKESYEVARSDLRYLRVLRQGNGEWALDTQAGTVFSGATLPQALCLVLPFMGRWSGSEEHQRGAVQLIQSAGGSEGYIAGLHRRNLETLWSWTRSERLALEMASNEDVERRALEGELRLLLAAWREAEELARIVDGLLVPLPIEERLRQLKVLSASWNGRPRRRTRRVPHNGTVKLTAGGSDK